MHPDRGFVVAQKALIDHYGTLSMDVLKHGIDHVNFRLAVWRRVSDRKMAEKMKQLTGLSCRRKVLVDLTFGDVGEVSFDSFGFYLLHPLPTTA